MTKSRIQPKLVLFLIIAIVVFPIVGWFTAQYWYKPQVRMPEGLRLTYLPEGKPLVDFDLRDHTQHAFGLERLKGKWSFLFFGYTNCPDVCPSTMFIMRDVWSKLPAEVQSGAQPQLIFVSVDPERDTLEKLSQYVSYYHPDFIGITGQNNQLDILTTQLGVLYGYEDPEEGTEFYVVNHSSQLVLIDPDANMRAIISPPFDADKIAQAFVVIKQANPG